MNTTSRIGNYGVVETEAESDEPTINGLVVIISRPITGKASTSGHVKETFSTQKQH